MPVYLDHAASSPLRPEVARRLNELWELPLGNPSSLHGFGHRARMVLEEAREVCAGALSAQVEEIVFTSGATEANNLALDGVLSRCPPGAGLVISAVEHPSVYDKARQLAERGYRVEMVGVDRHGQVDPDHIAARVGADTALVSVMAVNNEVGSLQPMAELARRRSAWGHTLLHVDAVQARSAGLDLAALRRGVDLMSISGHKLGAPVGCGLLYVRRGLQLNPVLVGGAQEDSRRAGTSNAIAAAALARALELPMPGLQALRERLERGLRGVPGATLLGADGPRAAHISAWVFDPWPAEPVLVRLDLAQIAASSGSACSSHSLEPSRVVQAMGYPEQAARGLVRFSLGWNTTEGDIDTLLQTLPGLLGEMRRAA